VKCLFKKCDYYAYRRTTSDFLFANIVNRALICTRTFRFVYMKIKNFMWKYLLNTIQIHSTCSVLQYCALDFTPNVQVYSLKYLSLKCDLNVKRFCVHFKSCVAVQQVLCTQLIRTDTRVVPTCSMSPH